MASQVDIINLALVRLGQDTINAIYPTEETTEARLATGLWVPCLKAVLRMHHWNFAIKTVELVSTTALDGYDYAFTLPSDCIKAIDLLPIDDAADQLIYEIWSGSVLVTDLETAWLKYIYYVTDTTKFDDSFVEALSYKLALDLAMPITGKPDIQRAMAQLYGMAIQTARLADAQEIRKTDPRSQTILDSRA